MTVLPCLIELNETITKNGLITTFDAVSENVVGYKTVSITTETGAIETKNADDIIKSTTSPGTIYKYLGNSTNELTYGYLYIIEE